MSEKMIPLTIDELLSRLTAEYKAFGTAFDVRAPYRAKDKTIPIFTEKLEVPLGPAAGPNTQLAENIIAAYFAGARFFELKTVQTLDGEDLAKCINRPCIKADDEGYNCEWSTELTVPQAFEEYVKAWCVLKVISKVWGLGAQDGFVFNMSVGYDLEGIKSEKIDRFIEGLKDASDAPIFAECKAALLKYFPEYAEDIEAISPAVCTSVTLSTLHGCPPDEIERIATYLLSEKHLNTFVKCNPTILGYKDARAILDSMGFDYVAFDEHHFNEDLQYADAVEMFHRLTALSEKEGLSFGLKLSNTFPVDVKAGELPSEEMYMSGRSLFSLTIEMARRFSAEFGGKLRISYSGGADAFNIGDLFSAGIYPITVATTILKPGGYMRLSQLADILTEGDYSEWRGTDTEKITALRDRSHDNKFYRKPIKPLPRRKSDEQVPLMDCYIAPCSGGCPIHQDIPEYLRLCEKGEYEKALGVITEKNPLPFITGTICSHRCMTKCTRNFYDESVDIRGAKLLAAEGGYDALIKNIAPKEAASDIKAAVIGAGPAGLSAAYFLCREGAQVDVYERDAYAGGIVRNIIPGFRISDEAIEKDVQLIRAMGANILLSTPAPSVDELKAQGYTHIIFAVGAYKAQDPRVEGNVINVLDFLRSAKSGDPLDLGRAVAVIGGGNTAMDAARAAKRIPGVEEVTIVYRRTKKQMPADEEELYEAIEDGVKFAELVSPVRQESGELVCNVMKLGEPDESGRRRPEPTGETTVIPADTVIAAIGERVDNAYFKSQGIACDERGRVGLVTNLDNVYNIGDSRRGPSTVVECIADAQAVADRILGHTHTPDIPLEAFTTPDAVIPRKGILLSEKTGGYTACLSCSTVCENCVDVCPNRANTVIIMPDGRREILHIDQLCNECGNCASFCPYASAPYKDKLTLFKDEASFIDSENKGFVFTSDGVKVRLDERTADIDKLIAVVKEKYGYLK